MSPRAGRRSRGSNSEHAAPCKDAYGARHRLRGRQVVDRRGTLPGIPQLRAQRAPFQAAKHVEQCGCHRRRRRDWPGPGVASKSLRRRPEPRHEPGPFETPQRQWRASGPARARALPGPGARVSKPGANSFAGDRLLGEGAGSASEINLRQGDIANMGFARAANVPVILLADIERGGVIAQIVGTRSVIDPADAQIIAGFLINKFRGDPSLFADGMGQIEQLTGWPSFGLIPFCPEAAHLPEEDSLGLFRREAAGSGVITIAVPVLPGIANFDDLDPLYLEPGVRVVMVKSGRPLPAEASLVILPGSKTTIADLAAFRCEGWDIDLYAHVRHGGHVFGICGGYQMLGKVILDPLGLEGPPGEAHGLGLLDIETVLGGEKVLSPVHGISAADNVPFDGYEMHLGRTIGPDCSRPVVHISDGRADGARSANGRVSGCYVHGLFAHPAQRSGLLARLGGKGSNILYEETIEAALDAVASHLEAHIELGRLLSIAR